MSSGARRSVRPRSIVLLLTFALVLGAWYRPGPTAATPKKKPATPPADASPITPDLIRSLAWRPIGPATMGGRISEIALVQPPMVEIGRAHV